MSDVDRVLKQLRGLKQNKDKSDEDLLAIAKEKISKQEIIGSLTFCVSDEEKTFASSLLERYFAEGSLETEAEKDTLRQLIDLEVMMERVKKFLNVEYGKANPLLPTAMMEQLQSLNTQVIELKEKLGLLNKDKKQESWLEAMELLKKKALKYYEEHKGCNVVRCPHCQNLFLLLMRTENLEAIKATMFKGTILYNKPLFELYHTKVITKEKISEILGVSDKYIDIIYENLFCKELKESHDS